MASRAGADKFRCWFLLLVVGVCTSGAGSTHAVAQELSGTIQYKGSRASVSDSQPISIYLAPFDSSPGLLDVAYVPTNGGAFTLHAPAPGDYALFFSVDSHDYRDESLSVGAPFEVYKDCLHFSFPEWPPPCGEPITVPQTGVALEFDDTAILSGIAGTAVYSGSQGGPCTCVQAFSDPTLSGSPDSRYCCGQNGRYELLPLDPGNLYSLRAFQDLNDNRQFDPGEPFKVYAGNPVVASSTQTDVNFTFGDENIEPVACVGNCDDDHFVTIDELLAVVNIALGNAHISMCMAGDTNHDSQITIDEILTAVNNALTGCG